MKSIEEQRKEHEGDNTWMKRLESPDNDFGIILGHDGFVLYDMAHEFSDPEIECISFRDVDAMKLRDVLMELYPINKKGNENGQS